VASVSPLTVRPGVFVVATTPEGTIVALKTALDLAGRQLSDIDLVVPQIVPAADVRHGYGPASGNWTMLRAAYAARNAVTPQVGITLARGRSIAEAVLECVPADATVVLGVVPRWWHPWRSREERLGARLKRAGRRVEFATPRPSHPRREWTGPTCAVGRPHRASRLDG